MSLRAPSKLPSPTRELILGRNALPGGWPVNVPTAMTADAIEKSAKAEFGNRCHAPLTGLRAQGEKTAEHRKGRRLLQLHAGQLAAESAISARASCVRLPPAGFCTSCIVNQRKSARERADDRIFQGQA